MEHIFSHHFTGEHFSTNRHPHKRLGLMFSLGCDLISENDLITFDVGYILYLERGGKHQVAFLANSPSILICLSLLSYLVLILKCLFLFSSLHK